MRYTSLRIISLIYKVAGVLGALLTFVLFIGIAGGGREAARLFGLNWDAAGVSFAYWSSFILSLVVLLVGLIGSLTTYAVGAFIMLMISVEQSLQNIDHHFNRADYPGDYDPVNPRPLADFPPSRFSSRPARTPEQVRRPGKWDMGK